MTTSSYLSGRQKYQRPQAVLFSENSGTISNGFFVPDGIESNGTTDGSFLILSDHNRSPIDFKVNRLEQRKRTINGKMRAYHVADKLSLTLSWTDLPSRSFASNPNFTDSGTTNSLDYTVDGGAGGNELLKWYENHAGSFYVFLAYDKYTNFENSANPYDHLGQYNQVVEMFISDFSYSIPKRGSTNHDLWTVNISLEEV